MAGAITFSYDDGYDKNGERGSIRKVIASWTSDTSGDAAGTSAKINGYLLKGVTNPTDSPTDDYDIVLTDSDGANLLDGAFANLTNRDTTNTETRLFNLTDGTVPIGAYPEVNSTITVTVAAAGSTKSGVLTIYYRVR
jgi:hypothetical protein